MNAQERRQTLRYALADFISLNFGWLVCSSVRYILLYGSHGTFEAFLAHLATTPVLLGQAVIPLLMMALYWLSGYYNHVFFKSRTEEFVNTLTVSLIGSILTYFIVLVNDAAPDRISNYAVFGILYLCLFVPVYFVRLIITTTVTRRIKRREIMFDTIIAGTGQGCRDMARRINRGSHHNGFRIVGFADNDAATGTTLDGLPVFNLDSIDDTVRSLNISRIIVAPQHGGPKDTAILINRLFRTGAQLFVSPELWGMMLVRPRVSDVAGEPLVNISQVNIPAGYINCKRVLDVLGSAVTLTVISPVLAVIALCVRFTSSGPVIYRQQRVGYHKRPFTIYKFRTMVHDAEKAGLPKLSSEDDPRVTRVGRILRKYRLDELPQFWNVLKGDMSLVGPRPERAYYIHQIVERAPYYSLVHQVRPGITSWGMVKFGYARDVDEMIKRLQYDLLYLENISLGVDLRILIHTIHTVTTGKGL